MTGLEIHSTRGDVVESVHCVSVAVCDADGALHAAAGDPGRVTFMRSAAKPFQALPLVDDGVTDHYGITSEELALACASHSSEPQQVRLVSAWLERVGCTEDDLVCGPHRPLSRELAVRDSSQNDARAPAPSRLTSNCSGKHTGMLALARHHGWETRGYHLLGHPVQDRVQLEVSRYLRLSDAQIRHGVDGCGVVSFAVPLRAMAAGFARLAAADGDAPRAIVDAMVSHPDLVGGRGRLCTELMRAYPGTVLAKVGAEGVYGAALLDRCLGIAMKVDDGNNWAAVVALVAVLGQLKLTPHPSHLIPQFAERPVLNTRGETVGVMRSAGQLSLV